MAWQEWAPEEIVGICIRKKLNESLFDFEERALSLPSRMHVPTYVLTVFF